MGITSFRAFYGEELVLRGALEEYPVDAELKIALGGPMTGLSYDDITSAIWRYQELASLGHEIVSTGYTAGGKVLTRNSIASTFSAPFFAYINSNGLSWLNLTEVVKYAFLYSTVDFYGNSDLTTLAIWDLEDTGGSLNLAADDLYLSFAGGTLLTQALV